jgi:hypothetical protein
MVDKQTVESYLNDISYNIYNIVCSFNSLKNTVDECVICLSKINNHDDQCSLNISDDIISLSMKIYGVHDKITNCVSRLLIGPNRNLPQIGFGDECRTQIKQLFDSKDMLRVNREIFKVLIVDLFHEREHILQSDTGNLYMLIKEIRNDEIHHVVSNIKCSCDKTSMLTIMYKYNQCKNEYYAKLTSQNLIDISQKYVKFHDQLNRCVNIMIRVTNYTLTDLDKPDFFIDPQMNIPPFYNIHIITNCWSR